MWIDILHNMHLVGFIATLFGALIIADMIIGAYYNVRKLNEKFKWARFSKGLIKGAAVLAANFILAAVITAFPYFLMQFGIPFNQDVLNTITIIVLIAIWARAVERYIQKLFEKTQLILGKIIPENTEQK